MAKNPNVERLVDQILQEYKERPVDLLGHNDGAGEYRYLCNHREQYVRTVRDILDQAPLQAGQPALQILEIGPFLGVVSILLARLGYSVVVFDIEEYLACPRLCAKFQREGVRWTAGNLRDPALPFRDDEFDVVLICETLEHLNFNPLPVVDQIHRVLKMGGCLYATVPNLAREGNRIKLLRGQSIHNPIQDYFAQLDPRANMGVGLHWREYTAREIREMLERLDFTIQSQRIDSRPGQTSKLGRLLKKIIHRGLNLPLIRPLIYGSLVDPDDPALGPTHVAVASKISQSGPRFPPAEGGPRH